MAYNGTCRPRVKCDGTRVETRFCLSAKRTSPFKSEGGRQFTRLLAAEVCASAVVMLDTPFSEVVWRVLATHSIHQFPLHFPSSASPCAITFQLDSTNWWQHVFSSHRQEASKRNIFWISFVVLLCHSERTGDRQYNTYNSFSLLSTYEVVPKAVYGLLASPKGDKHQKHQLIH